MLNTENLSLSRVTLRGFFDDKNIVEDNMVLILLYKKVNKVKKLLNIERKMCYGICRVNQFDRSVFECYYTDLTHNIKESIRGDGYDES